METYQRSRVGRKRRSSFRVLVAIAALQRATVPRADPLDRSADVVMLNERCCERPPALHTYLSSCQWAQQPTQYHPCGTPVRLAILSAGTWKPIAVHSAHLPTAMSFRRNEQGDHAIDRQAFRSALAHAGRIQPVALGQPALRAVIPGQPTRATLHGQAERLEAFVQRPARTVDGGCVPKRSFGLCQEPLEQVGLALEELVDVLGPLPGIAGFAGEREIAYAARATTGAAHHVLDLQRHVCGTTVCTLPSPLLEQIRAHLAACQRPLLILHTRNFRLF